MTNCKAVRSKFAKVFVSLFILGFLFGGLQARANSAQRYECAPYPLVPGFGSVVRIYENQTQKTAELKVIAEGRVTEAYQVQKTTQADGRIFVDAATDGNTASMVIKNTWIKNAGFVSLFFDHGVNASYSCMPVN